MHVADPAARQLVDQLDLAVDETFVEQVLLLAEADRLDHLFEGLALGVGEADQHPLAFLAVEQRRRIHLVADLDAVDLARMRAPGASFEPARLAGLRGITSTTRRPGPRSLGS